MHALRRDVDDKGGPAPRLALDANGAAEKIDHRSDHREAEPDAVSLVGHLAESREGLEKSRDRSALTPGPVSVTTNRSARLSSS